MLLFITFFVFILFYSIAADQSREEKLRKYEEFIKKAADLAQSVRSVNVTKVYMAALESKLATTPRDPCMDLFEQVKVNKINPRAVAACYRFFPSNRALEVQTTASVAQLLSMYAFLDYAADKDNFKESDAKYNVASKVTWIFSRPFALDWTYQEKFASLFVPLYDGHTRYIPYCYRAFVFTQPFYLVPIYYQGTTKIIIYGVVPGAPEELKQFVGSEVVTIDNVEATGAIQKFADLEYGNSKSYRTRFNKALSSPVFQPESGTFTYELGAFSLRKKLPQRPYIMYGILTKLKLKTGKPVKGVVPVRVPWTAKPSGGLYFPEGAKGYFSRYCLRKKREKAFDGTIRFTNSIFEDLWTADTDNGSGMAPGMNSGQTKGNYGGSSGDEDSDDEFEDEEFEDEEGFEDDEEIEDTEDEGEEQDDEDLEADFVQLVRRGVNDLPTSVPRAVQLDTPLVKGSTFAAYFLGGSPAVGVLIVTSFDVYTADGVADWLNKLQLAYQKFISLGVRRIILDLSNNGGGNICLAYGLTAILNPSEKHPFPFPRKSYTTRMRISPLMDAITKNANAFNDPNSPFRPSTYLDPDTYKPFTVQKWKGKEDPDLRRRAIGNLLAAGPPAPPPNPFKQENAQQSRQLMDNCLAMANHPISQLRLKDMSIAVVSNGFCGSSCAIVAANLRESAKNAKSFVTLAQGDFEKKKIAGKTKRVYPPLFSFAGGQVISANQLFNYFSKIGFTNDTLAPQEFPTTADFYFTFRQIFGLDARKLPLEYSYIRSQKLVRINSKTVMRPVRVWVEIARQLEWFPEKDKDVCTSDFVSRWGNVCDDGYDYYVMSNDKQEGFNDKHDAKHDAEDDYS